MYKALIFFMNYLNDLKKQISNLNNQKVDQLVIALKRVHKNKKNIFICGNGGSAANANHITNDLMHGFTKKKIGFRFISLCSNIAKLTCLGNDIGYHKIFSNQLNVLGNRGDLLIILSGSGNSKNIQEVIKEAKKKGIFTYGLIGFNGGKAKKMLKDYIHFNINDMQICEDMQMIVMNLVMKKIIQEKFKF